MKSRRKGLVVFGAVVCALAVVGTGIGVYCVATWLVWAASSQNAEAATLATAVVTFAAFIVSTLYLLATLVVAISGVVAVLYSRRAAGAAMNSAAAARRAVDESHRQRLAAVTPYLVFEEAQKPQGAKRPGEEFEVMVRVRNVGNGPALDPVFSLLHPQLRYLVSRLPVLATGQVGHVQLGFGSGWAVPGGVQIPRDLALAGTLRSEYTDLEGRWWASERRVTLWPRGPTINNADTGYEEFVEIQGLQAVFMEESVEIREIPPEPVTHAIIDEWPTGGDRAYFSRAVRSETAKPRRHGSNTRKGST